MMDWCRHSDDLERMQRFVLSASKGLIEVTCSVTQGASVEPVGNNNVDKDPGADEDYDHLQVQFIHETVRDYFLAGGGLSKLRPDLQPNVIAWQSGASSGSVRLWQHACTSQGINPAGW
jgi:hypothetical protein